MAHSRQFRSPRAVSSRRTTIWSQGPESGNAQSVTTAGLTIITTGQVSGGGVTVVRLRGMLSLWIEATTAIGDGFQKVSAGIGIVTDDAFSIGATAMPSPITDPNWGGWFWYQQLGSFIGDSTTETFRFPMQARKVEIDTKAMRKIQPNEVIFGAVAVSNEVGASTLTFHMDTRMLVKLT